MSVGIVAEPSYLYKMVGILTIFMRERQNNLIDEHLSPGEHLQVLCHGDYSTARNTVPVMGWFW